MSFCGRRFNYCYDQDPALIERHIGRRSCMIPGDMEHWRTACYSIVRSVDNFSVVILVSSLCLCHSVPEAATFMVT